MTATITERLRALSLPRLRGDALVASLLDRCEADAAKLDCVRADRDNWREQWQRGGDALRGTVEQLTADLEATRQQRDEARAEAIEQRRGEAKRALRAQDEAMSQSTHMAALQEQLAASRAEMAALDADRGAIARDLLAARAQAEALSAELRAPRRDLHDAVAGLGGARCPVWMTFIDAPMPACCRGGTASAPQWAVPSQRCAPVAAPVADPDRVAPQPAMEAGRWQWPPGSGWTRSSTTGTMEAPLGMAGSAETMRRGADGVWRWVR